MESSLRWHSEEEGILRVSGELLELCFNVYRIGDEEAEVSLQDMAYLREKAVQEVMQKEITSEMTICLKETFRLLWDEGLEEAVILERKGSEFGKILDSTNVVRLAYSEYMMKKVLQPGQYTMDGDGVRELMLEDREEGRICENRSRNFFCHLQAYKDGWYLFEVEVKKSARNKGIATACLKELFDRLSEQGPAAVYLQVGSYNEPAMHLYGKLGFQVSEELCYYGPAET